MFFSFIDKSILFENVLEKMFDNLNWRGLLFF